MKSSSLPSMLKELRLPSMGIAWEGYAAEAIEKRWSPQEYLAHLCELELSSRESRRLQRHFQESRLPKGKSLQTFDFAAAPSVNRQEIEALAEDIGSG